MSIEHITDTEWEWYDEDEEDYTDWFDQDTMGYDGDFYGDDEEEDFDPLWQPYPIFPPEPWHVQLYWRIRNAVTRLISSIKWRLHHA